VNLFNSILILVVAFLAVFAEAAFSLPHRLLGAQIDLLPALMIYAALNLDIVTVSLLAPSTLFTVTEEPKVAVFWKVCSAVKVLLVPLTWPACTAATELVAS